MKKYLALLVALLLLLLLASCGGEDAENKIIVSYMTDGTVYATDEAEEGERIEVPGTLPEKEGYSFDGWYWDKDEWKKPYDPTDLNRDFLVGKYQVYAHFVPLSFRLNDDLVSYTVTGALSGFSGGELVIPRTYRGKPVTAIAENAFKNVTSFTALAIPDSVASIGYSAFEGCAITSLKLPNATDMSIGQGAFARCTALVSVDLGATLLDLTGFAFEGCTSLENVLAYKLRSVGGSAFKDCTALKEITLPATLKYIYRSAFEGCSALSTVSVPGTLESIGERAFFGCAQLMGITYRGESKLQAIGDEAFVGTSITSLSLPKTIVRLYSGSFPSTLLTLSIEKNSLIRIERGAFAGISANAEVVFHGTLADFDAVMKDPAWSEGREVAIRCDDGTLAP